MNCKKMALKLKKTKDQKNKNKKNLLALEYKQKEI